MAFDILYLIFLVYSVLRLINNFSYILDWLLVVNIESEFKTDALNNIKMRNIVATYYECHIRACMHSTSQLL